MTLLFTALSLSACDLTDSFRYTKDKADLAKYYDLASDEAVIYFDNEAQEDVALVYDGVFYIPMSTVRELLDKRFYWDKENERLLFTDSESIREEDTDDSSMVYVRDDEIYLSEACLEKYLDVQLEAYENPGRVFIDEGGDMLMGIKAARDTEVRIKGGPKSEILTKLNKEDSLYLIDEMNSWGHVRTSDGYMGYTELKYLDTEEQTQIPIETGYSPSPDHSISRDHTICMVWQDMAGRYGNTLFEGLIDKTSGVNVVSPVWFVISDNDGNYDNFSSASYVEYAHKKGMEVWVLVNDFSNDVSISKVLTNSKVRQKMVDNLVKDTLAVKADGINVDFEFITDACGQDFIQFLRELSLACHEHDLVLSVDNKNPTYIKYCYDMREQGKVADYVVLMGYDEHWVGSEAGSVASLDYVDQGIMAALDLVPAEKIISGLPFYARVWTETPAEYASAGAEIRNDGNSRFSSYALDSSALSMDEIQDVIRKNGVSPEWRDSCGQNYVEYEKGNSVQRIWVEDAESLDLKMQKGAKHKLAGYAFWRLGYENKAVWNMIEKYLD